MACGTGLPPEERARLDQDGYVVLHGVLTFEQAAQFARRLDELLLHEGPRAGTETRLEPGTARLANLVDKDPMFEVCVVHPWLLAAVGHVLDHDLKLSGLNCRVALPGSGRQDFHADWGEPVPRGSYRACNSIWCIDEFCSDNGATEVVPGSHLLERMPTERGTAGRSSVPPAVLVTAPAGSVIVLNAHVWHRGSRNVTDRPRRALHSYFVRRSEPQQQDQRRLLSRASAARLSPVARFLLDV